MFLLVLVLSIAVLVLVLDSIQHSDSVHWSTSDLERPQSTTGIAAVQQPTSTSTLSLSTASLSTSTTKCDANHERIPLTEREVEALHKSKTTDRALRSNSLFMFLLVLVLSIAVLVLVLDSIQHSDSVHWSTSDLERPQSTTGIAAVQQPTSTSTLSLSTASLSTSTTKYAAMNDLSCSLATSTWKNLHQRKHRPARIVRKGSGFPFVGYEQKGRVCR